MTEAVLSALKADWKEAEGWRPYVYDDATGKRIVTGTTVLGNPTIGWGFCVEAGTAEGLPEEIAELWLDNVIQAHARDLSIHLAWYSDLDAVRQRALLEMCLNLGIVKLLGFRQMLKALKAGEWERAEAEALDSEWARKDVGPVRAGRIGRMFRTGRDA